MEYCFKLEAGVLNWLRKIAGIKTLSQMLNIILEVNLNDVFVDKLETD